MATVTSGLRGFLRRAPAMLLMLWVASTAHAWSGHSMVTWEALAPLPQLAALQVPAESLEHFAQAEAPALQTVLAGHEAWARAQLPDYAPRPDDLAFRADATRPSARDRLLLALRLNPFARLPLFRQLRPGEALPPGREALPWNAVTALASGIGARAFRYVGLAEGENVSALDVLASASAEPDYGLDLSLFADSGTPHGARFGFGAQPFGNAKVDYASQAPFHMGFHHEARVVFAAAGFLKRTQTESRVALFSALARHAFASGHAYWGYRFTGWALHYVQDLTQPYHARVLPGVGVARMLAINALAMAGRQGPKNAAITRVSNRHTVVENYQVRRMAQALDAGRRDDALLAALRDTARDREHPRHETADLRTRVSQEAFDAGDALDAQLERAFPSRYTDDPSVELGVEADLLDLYAVARQHSASEHAALEQRLLPLMVNLGRHSRALVRALVPLPGGWPAP